MYKHIKNVYNWTSLTNYRMSIYLFIMGIKSRRYGVFYQKEYMLLIVIQN